MRTPEPVTTLTNAEHMHLRRALAVASTSTMTNRHGAVIAVGKRVLAVGVNSRRSHPLVCSNPKTESAFHAEVAALRQLRGSDLSRATLFVARHMGDGSAGVSRPCKFCQGAIDQSGIGEVVFTTGNAMNPFEKWRA